MFPGTTYFIHWQCLELDYCLENNISDIYFQVSEDETMVKRTTPVPEPRNVDAETIYIVSI